jgi:hypothetical protein
MLDCDWSSDVCSSDLRFIPGAWEPYAKSAKLAEVNAALAMARQATPARVAKAG